MIRITKKYASLALIFVFSSILVGCEDPLDCIIDDRPVLNTQKLSQPILNQVFDASITVSVQNNIHDDQYYYDWRLEGALPSGVSYSIDKRVLTFSGTPTALGRYSYSVNVYVRSDLNWQDTYGLNAAELCRQSIKRNYTMDVASM